MQIQFGLMFLRYLVRQTDNFQFVVLMNNPSRNERAHFT